MIWDNSHKSKKLLIKYKLHTKCDLLVNFSGLLCFIYEIFVQYFYVVPAEI